MASTAERQAIDRVRDAHVAALNRGDADAWVALFTEDGVQMPPNASANVGRPMIRSWVEALLAPFRLEFALAVDEVRAAGAWAFERGTYRIALMPKAGGDALRDTGKYITIYERQPDGAWRMARDIWNSNHPSPGPPR